MLKRWVLIWCGLAGIGLGAVAVGSLAWYRQTHPPLVPGAVLQAAPFDVLVPQAPGVSVSRESMKYSPQDRVLTFSMLLDAPFTKIIVTQQPVPHSGGASDGFTTALRQARPYHDLSSKAGEVVIYTGSAETTGRTAVLVAKNTVVYLTAEKELADVTWQKILDSMTATTKTK